MKSVEEQIKTYYTSKSLSLAQLAKLKAQSKQAQKKRVLRKVCAYAAVFIMAIGLGYGFYVISAQQEYKKVYAFAAEVALNHQKQAIVDYTTADVTTLNTKMPRLNFTITIPKALRTQYTLVGGRYCAIDNRIAAQLKMKNNEGAIVTLYVFKKKEHFTFHEHITFDTTSVTIWDDHTLIYALASK